MTAPSISRLRASRHQRGVYAVEYALVFPIFFVLVYAVVSYGIVFAVRLGMQNAAEDGARAGLRHPASTCSDILECRRQTAEDVAKSRISWLATTDVTALRCRIGVECTTSVPTCGTTLQTRCQIMVVVTYDYLTNPIAPPLPIFDFLPKTLQGRASVLLVAGFV